MHSSRMHTVLNSSHLLGGGGLLSWPFVVVFCYALLLWPSGLVACSLKVAFWLKVVFCYGLLVRPSGVVPSVMEKATFNQKDTKPEGHNRRPQQKAITEGHTNPPQEQAPPWEQAPHRQIPLNFPLGCGPGNPQGMLGYPPSWRPAARHAGIPPAMHAGIATPPPWTE